MRNIVVLVLLSVLTGCSSTPLSRYYQLPPDSAPSRSAVVYEKGDEQSAVWVEPVVLTDALAGSGIVYQKSDVQYAIAGNHLWATPLDQQLQQLLVNDLSRRLPERLISAQPLGQHPISLSVSVSGFHGRFDGMAIITGDWVLDQHGTLVSRSFSLVLPQQKDGYDALVLALAKGWHEEAEKMADVIRNTK